MSKKGWREIIAATTGHSCLHAIHSDNTIYMPFHGREIEIIRFLDGVYYIYDSFTGNTTHSTSVKEVIDHIRMMDLLPTPTLSDSIKSKFAAKCDNNYIEIERGRHFSYRACEGFVWMDDKLNYTIIARGEPVKVNGKKILYDLETLIGMTCGDK